MFLPCFSSKGNPGTSRSQTAILIALVYPLTSNPADSETYYCFPHTEFLLKPGW